MLSTLIDISMSKNIRDELRSTKQLIYISDIVCFKIKLEHVREREIFKRERNLCLFNEYERKKEIDSHIEKPFTFFIF